MSQPGWYPDPTGRNAQRYFDGSNWTDQVVTASGGQTTDPVSGPASAPSSGPAPASEPTQAFATPPAAPPSSAPPPSAPPPTAQQPQGPQWGAAPSAWGPGIPATAQPATAGGATGTALNPVALGVAAVGLLLVILSVFSLDFVKDGSFSDVRKVIDAFSDADADSGVGAINEIYVKFGYILTLIAAGGLGIASAFVKKLWPAAVAAGAVGFIWHTVTLFDTTGDGVDAAIGGWLGMIGYLALAAAGIVAYLQTKPEAAQAPVSPYATSSFGSPPSQYP